MYEEITFIQILIDLYSLLKIKMFLCSFKGSFAEIFHLRFD